jgi:hypothetical protein
MGAEYPDLEMFHHEWIDGVEERRSHRLRGGQDHEMPDATIITSNPPAMSRESTATLRAMSEADNSHGWYGSNAADDEMDIDGREQRTPSEIDETLMPIIVATDFGTTFSSVAFARREDGLLPDVKIIDSYPSDPADPMGNSSRQVPTESWYPNEPKLEEASRSPTPLLQTSTHSNTNGNLYAADTEDEGEQEEVLRKEEPRIQQPLTEQPLSSFIWGYGIQNEISPDMDQRKFNRIARSKLWLDKSNHTVGVRNELEPILRRLKRKKVIKENEDVIADYLTRYSCMQRYN